jgi:hypothetical protein
VKPWDDETDMKKLEEAVRSVQMEGLFWGACMFFILILLVITFELQKGIKPSGFCLYSIFIEILFLAGFTTNHLLI